jgi:DNA helicase-2/ATP-dependent DNA helicase PcrA
MIETIEKLNNPQKEAVLTTEGPLMVIAGAGSGKTRVLTQRIAHLILDIGVPKNQILAITFTNKAASEMKTRLFSLLGESTRDMWISTFHAMGVRILREHGERIGLSKHFQILDDDDSSQLIKSLMKDAGISKDLVNPKTIKNMVLNLKSKRLDLDSIEAPLNEYVQTIYKSYEDKLRKNQLVDFEDLIGRVIELFEKDKEIRDFYHTQFAYILVDEFQDTNDRQYELIKHLTGPHKNLFVVGDEDQSIYAFRGANIKNIQSFQKDFTPKKVVLDQNYRSTNTILSAANQVIKKNPNRIDKELFSDKGDGPQITFFKAQDSTQEIGHIIHQIGIFHKEGIPYEEMAILYRTNALNRTLEQTIKGSHIPYKIIGSISYFKRKEVKDIMAYLRMLINPNDDVSFERVINEPKRGIGAKTLNEIKNVAGKYDLSFFETLEEPLKLSSSVIQKLDHFKTMIKTLRKEFERQNFNTFLEYLIDVTGYKQSLENEARKAIILENIFELASYFQEQLLRNQTYENIDILMMMLEDFALKSTDDETSSNEGVSLMTLHGVKGLEFEVVFMMALEKGIFPSWQTFENVKELEEERRLMYVGITRAKKHLVFTNAKERLLYGQFQHNPDSDFIDDIDPKLIQYTGSNLEKQKNSASHNEEAFLRRRALEKRKAHLLENENELSEGDAISHERFGNGKVVSIQGDQCVIAFSYGVGLKTLMKNHPAIKKVTS